MEKKRITIDPITRLEGHGKIEIFLNEEKKLLSIMELFLMNWKKHLQL